MPNTFYPAQAAMTDEQAAKMWRLQRLYEGDDYVLPMPPEPYSLNLDRTARRAEGTKMSNMNVGMIFGMLAARPRTTAVTWKTHASSEKFMGVAEHGEFDFQIPDNAIGAVAQAMLQGDPTLARLWIEAGVCFPPGAKLALVGVVLFRDVPITRDEGATWENQDTAQFHMARGEGGMQRKATKINVLMKDFPSDLLPVQIGALL